MSEAVGSSTCLSTFSYFWAWKGGAAGLRRAAVGEGGVGQEELLAGTGEHSENRWEGGGLRGSEGGTPGIGLYWSAGLGNRSPVYHGYVHILVGAEEGRHPARQYLGASLLLTHWHSITYCKYMSFC